MIALIAMPIIIATIMLFSMSTMTMMITLTMKREGITVGPRNRSKSLLAGKKDNAGPGRRTWTVPAMRALVWRKEERGTESKETLDRGQMCQHSVVLQQTGMRHLDASFVADHMQVR